MPRVADFIKRRPVTTQPGVSIRVVADIMVKNNVGSVVLVDNSGKPVGIVTERDVVRALARGLSADDAVDKIATTEGLVTARWDEDIYEALRKMRGRGVRHLIIVGEDGSLIGVLSMRDLLEDMALKHLGERVWWPPPED